MKIETHKHPSPLKYGSSEMVEVDSFVFFYKYTAAGKTIKGAAGEGNFRL